MSGDGERRRSPDAGEAVCDAAVRAATRVMPGDEACDAPCAGDTGQADVAPAAVPGNKAGATTVREIDTTRVLCRLDELGGGTREFRIGGGDWPLRGFVVRVRDGVRAYVNRCAHMDYQLNYTEHEFLTQDGSMIFCYVHGALFEKDTGYCVAGPCAGLSLAPLPVRIEGDYVLLADEADVEALAERYA